MGHLTYKGGLNGAPERKMLRVVGALVLFVLVGSATPRVASALGDALPKAETILEEYVEAIGGRAAYAKLNTRITELALEPLSLGTILHTTVYAARPNQVYSVTESESFGQIEYGIDGETVWERSPVSGPAIKEGEQRAFVVRSNRFDEAVSWRTLFKKVECVGIEVVGGRPCYEVVHTPTEGRSEQRYYDKATHLLVKMKLTVENPTGVSTTEIYLSDYRKIDGVLFPHKSRRTNGGQELLITTERIRHNMEIPADRFKLPDEVRALVEEKNKEAESSKAP